MAKINARDKGHDYELQIRDLFRENGWPEAVTSRMESKSKDDAGVDLCYTDPFFVQCKAIENMGSAHNILDAMPKPDGKHINVVFHKKNRRGTVVSMSMADFFTIIKQLNSTTNGTQV